MNWSSKKSEILEGNFEENLEIPNPSSIFMPNSVTGKNKRLVCCHNKVVMSTFTILTMFQLFYV